MALLVYYMSDWYNSRSIKIDLQKKKIVDSTTTWIMNERDTK